MRDNDSQKIIVVGIAKTLDDAALSELFSSFGTVADAKVVLDANTQQSRGFGFVTFTSGAAMRQAIQQMDKKVVDGRTLNVRQLVPKDKFQAKNAKSEPAPQDPANRPCWLLRKGKCTKGDLCPFSHETKNGEFGSCFEFMQTGECRRGDKCIFSHNIASDKKDEGGEDNSSTVREDETPAHKPQKTTQADRKIKSEPVVAGDGEQKKRVCYAYQKGKCHRGKKCLYLHEKVPEMVNDKPVATVKTAADAGVKRGEFEIVKVEGAGRKRSRAEDSHDDNSDGEDADDEETYSKPPPLKREPQQQVQSQKKSAPATAKTTQASKGLASHTPTLTVTPASAPRAAQAPRSQVSATQAKSMIESKPKDSENSKRSTEKRPRDAENRKTNSDGEPSEKRPRFDKNNRQPFDQREHPAAKRIYEREAKLNGPSKYGPGPQTPSQQQQQQPRDNKSKSNASDRFAKRAAQNNKNALQRQRQKGRTAERVVTQDGHQQEGDRPPQPSGPQRRAEKVDMGAAFDSDDERKPRGGSGGRPRVVDKALQRANREKLQQERRAKRDAKKSALGRLQTQAEVEL